MEFISVDIFESIIGSHFEEKTCCSYDERLVVLTFDCGENVTE